MLLEQAKEIYSGVTFKTKGYMNGTQLLYKSELNKSKAIVCWIDGEALELPNALKKKLNLFFTDKTTPLDSGVNFISENDCFRVPVVYFSPARIPKGKKIAPKQDEDFDTTLRQKLETLGESAPQVNIQFEESQLSSTGNFVIMSAASAFIDKDELTELMKATRKIMVDVESTIGLIIPKDNLASTYRNNINKLVDPNKVMNFDALPQLFANILLYKQLHDANS